MSKLLRGLRQWWNWRMRRAEVQVFGIHETYRLGTVTADHGVAWQVEDDDGRVARAMHDTQVPGVRVGDRVEIRPRFQSTAGTRLALVPDWIIVRRL